MILCDKMRRRPNDLRRIFVHLSYKLTEKADPRAVIAFGFAKSQVKPVIGNSTAKYRKA